VASARDLYAQVSDLKGEVSAGYMMATISKQVGQYQAALDQFGESLAAAQRGGWRQGEVQILATLGNTYLRLGGYAEAHRCHQQAMAGCRAMNDREGEAASLDVLGLVAADLGDLDAALQHFGQALSIQQAIGYRRGQGYTLTHMGHALLRLGQPAQAGEAFGQALAIRRELSPGSGASIDDLAGLALAALAQGEPAEAGRLAGECLAWIEAHGLDGMESPAQVYLACFQALQESDPPRATQALSQGYQHLTQLAGAIADPQLSRAVLENVPINRELIAAWQRVTDRQ
jgi:tetratricopeptide (TPR) repeat protein